MSSAPFVHLHLHSHYSFLRSTIRMKDLCARVAELGMPAVAVTDDANLFGAFELINKLTAKGIKKFAERAGHIPGAVNFEWTEAMDQGRNLRLKPGRQGRKED